VEVSSVTGVSTRFEPWVRFSLVFPDLRFYTVWVAPYFPQKRKSGKTSEKRTQGSKRVETPALDLTGLRTVDVVRGNPISVVGTGRRNRSAGGSHHINRPEARKVKGRSKARA
jgi:hypothetical protein